MQALGQRMKMVNIKIKNFKSSPVIITQKMYSPCPVVLNLDRRDRSHKLRHHTHSPFAVGKHMYHLFEGSCRRIHFRCYFN